MDLGIFFDDKYPIFERYALVLSKNRMTAEDIVMDVFRTLVERPELLVPIKNVEAYVMQSIKMRFFEIVRSNKMNDVAINEDWDPVDPMSSVDGDVVLKEILQKLDDVGQICKSILTLFGLGYTYTEISKIEEVEMGTLKSRLARCRTNLVMEY